MLLLLMCTIAKFTGQIGTLRSTPVEYNFVEVDVIPVTNLVDHGVFTFQSLACNALLTSWSCCLAPNAKLFFSCFCNCHTRCRLSCCERVYSIVKRVYTFRLLASIDTRVHKLLLLLTVTVTATRIVYGNARDETRGLV